MPSKSEIHAAIFDAGPITRKDLAVLVGVDQFSTKLDAALRALPEGLVQDRSEDGKVVYRARKRCYCDGGWSKSSSGRCTSCNGKGWAE